MLAGTKAQMCKDLGVAYLIDDQSRHCLGASEIGVTALLFGDYAWNHVEKMPDNVQQVRDWNAVIQYFDEQS